MPVGTTGVRLPVDNENTDPPLKKTPSRRRQGASINEPMPDEIKIVLADRIYIDRNQVPSSIVAELVRIAAFRPCHGTLANRPCRSSFSAISPPAGTSRRPTGSCQGRRFLTSVQDAEDMTAPMSSATPKVALDKPAFSRHDIARHVKASSDRERQKGPILYRKNDCANVSTLLQKQPSKSSGACPAGRVGMASAMKHRSWSKVSARRKRNEEQRTCQLTPTACHAVVS